MRNPSMAAELAIIWAEALYLASLGVALHAVAISALAHVMVVRVAEPELLERFGQRYSDCCRKVPRWIPRLGRES